MQSGELFVVGKDKIVINLHRFPSEVKVHFKGHDEIVPCNPHHSDTLEWEVHSTIHSSSGFALVIKWSVSSLREVVWQASY